MNDAANERERAKLKAHALELIDRLDHEIEELRRAAPPSYAHDIQEMTEAVMAIREAITEVG